MIMARIRFWASPSPGLHRCRAALYASAFATLRRDARSRPPFPPLRGDVSALTGNDRFCNGIAAVKPLFLLSLMSQVDPFETFMPASAAGRAAQEAVIRVTLLVMLADGSRQFV
jgi:hypothetical protein